MIELEFVDGPPERARSGGHREKGSKNWMTVALAPLVHRPGQWVRLEGKGSASGNIRVSQVLQALGEWEFVCRYGDLYVCYLGPREEDR